MPTVVLHPPAAARANTDNPLPKLLHTPSGLALVELQGSISSATPELAALEALELGRLVFPPPEGTTGGDWDGKRVILFVGDHQRLAGEVKKLPKPIAVVRRLDNATTDTDEVEIAEVIYQKMVFSHRPEPMGAAQQVVEAD